MELVKNKVIVWAVDDFNTLGLMRELGQPQIDLLFLVKGKGGMAIRSRYCKKYVETPTIEAGYDYLLSNFKEEKCKPIVLTSGDGIMTFIDQHKDILEKYFILPGTSKMGDTEKYIDKNTMTELAKSIGILCPQSRFLKWDSSLDGICYPCLIKPSHQKPGHYNEFKYRICSNESSLKNTLKLVRKDSEFIVQQYIEKEGDLLVYGGRMRDGKTILAGALLKDRNADSGSGSHGYITCSIPDGVDVEKICKFLEIIDYYGLFSFEYGKTPQKAYFFEVNLRNDGTSHYFYQAGANLPLAYIYSCAGLDYTSISTSVQQDGIFMDEVFDIENVLHCRLSIKKWKHDKMEATIYKYFAQDDQEPWKYVKKHMLKQIFQDIVVKKFRLQLIFVLDKLGLRK